MLEDGEGGLLIASALGGVILLIGGVLIGRRSARVKRRAPQSIKRTRQLGTFEARDSKGKVVVLSIYQEYLDAGSRDNPEAERKGRRIVMSSDGRHVDKLGTRKYRIMGTTEILTTEDLNAP